MPNWTDRTVEKSQFITVKIVNIVPDNTGAKALNTTALSWEILNPDTKATNLNQFRCQLWLHSILL